MPRETDDEVPRPSEDVEVDVVWVADWAGDGYWAPAEEDGQ